MTKTALRFGALLLLVGGALFLAGCRSMADSYGSDIPNDPSSWELQGVMGTFAH